MKKILFFLFLHLSYLSFSQMGIGTTTPRGALDINTSGTSVFGLVLPSNESPTNMVNPQGGNIAFGTIMYDSTDDCVKYYHQNSANDSIERWSPCILQVTDLNEVKLDYIESGNSFTGNYKKGSAMVTANRFRIFVTNKAFTSTSLTFSPSDLVLSGLTGVTVTAVTPTTSNLAAGATVELVYTLTGTPEDCGPLTGVWKKANLEFTKDVFIEPNLTYDCNAGSWNGTVAPEHRLDGLVTGQSYSGTYSIPYTDLSPPSNCNLPPETITVNGLTLTLTEGPVSASGIAEYVLSGTYTGTTGSVTFTTKAGCQIYLGPCRSCKEILEAFPGSADGVYRIDPDQGLNVFGVMNAQCDMTTDGGGWTMVLNYLHLGGTNPAVSIRTTTPLLGSSTLGENEATNTTTWGNANRALQLAMAPTEYRFYGITGAHSRVIHFKTAHAGSVTYFTRGTGNANGIQNSFTPLDGHTANLPATALTFSNGGVDRELIVFPFYTPNGSQTFQYHWNIGSARWEVDNTVNSNGASTLHRVWVR